MSSELCRRCAIGEPSRLRPRGHDGPCSPIEPQQIDIFGEDIEPEPELPEYMTRTLSATPVRLFEPQMEGQLDLLAATTNEGSSTDE